MITGGQSLHFPPSIHSKSAEQSLERPGLPRILFIKKKTKEYDFPPFLSNKLSECYCMIIKVFYIYI